MTLLGKLRVVPLLLLVTGMSVALGFAQNQSPPNQPPEGQSRSQPETPTPSGTSAPAKTTSPAAPNQEPPPASGQTSNQRRPRSRETKPRPPESKKTKTTESGKVVVANGGAKEQTGQLTPAMSKEQQARERENTSQLLATTDANLKSIAGRQLTPAQQNMLAQIHSYVNHSKAAAAAGDLARANTLASKAHLLSDELAKK